jgi:hypothetical protein
MTPQILVLSAASSSLLSWVLMANAVQASPSVSLPGIHTTLERTILNPESNGENPILRHLNCSCATCIRATVGG